MLDRNHRLRGEECQELSILLAERPLLGMRRRGDRTPQLTFEKQRLADDGPDPTAPLDDGWLGAREAAIVVHDDAGAALRDRPGHAFPQPDAQIGHPVAEPVPGTRDQRGAGLVPQKDNHGTDPEQLGREPADELQQPGQVRLAGQPGGHLAHGLELSAALVLAFEQLRVLDRNGCLPCERLQEPHIGRPETPLGPALHHQDADHPILVAQRDAKP